MHYLITLLLLCLSLESWSADQIIAAHFSAGKLDGWEEKVFKGKTHYQLIKAEDIQTQVLRAESQASASGLVKEITVDLNKTPVIHWSWRVKNSLENLDERTKEGDDYAARIYLVVSGGFVFWKTRSLNYVWASKMPVGSNWPNAYAKNNVIMVAQQTGNENAGHWRQEKRDLRADFKRYFGEDIKTIDAVAIMTDTDNSGQSATAWYGDIYFSSE